MAKSVAIGNRLRDLEAQLKRVEEEAERQRKAAAKLEGIENRLRELEAQLRRAEEAVERQREDAKRDSEAAKREAGTLVALLERERFAARIEERETMDKTIEAVMVRLATK